MTDEKAPASNNVSTLKPIITGGAARNVATLVGIPYINNNPIPCLFKAISCEIGNQLISMNQNIASVNTIHKTLYESSNEENSVNSLCPIHLPNLTDADVQLNKPVSYMTITVSIMLTLQQQPQLHGQI